jgi:hypothetical protein
MITTIGITQFRFARDILFGPVFVLEYACNYFRSQDVKFLKSMVRAQTSKRVL